MELVYNWRTKWLFIITVDGTITVFDLAFPIGKYYPDEGTMWIFRHKSNLLVGQLFVYGKLRIIET